MTFTLFEGFDKSGSKSGEIFELSARMVLADISTKPITAPCAMRLVGFMEKTGMATR
jgi:hypothetical protein